MKNNVIKLTILAIVIAMLTACGAAERAAAKHDELVRLYNSAVAATSGFGICADTAVAQINASNRTLSLYIQAETNRVSDWRSTQRAVTNDYTQARQEFAEFSNPDNGQVDLNQMVESGATPADVGSAFNIAVEAYAPTEAILSTLPTEVFTQVLDIQSGAVNTMMSCAFDWNAAAGRYNVEVSTINGLVDSGRIIRDAADALGITELPRRLPLYQSRTNDGTIPTLGD